MAEQRSNKCKDCGRELKAEYRVCPFCGNPTGIVCDECGKPLEEGFINCPYCGTKIASKTQKPPISPPVQGDSNEHNKKHNSGSQKVSIEKLRGKFSSFISRILSFIKSLDWKGFGQKIRSWLQIFGEWIKKVFQIILRVLGIIWGFLIFAFVKAREFLIERVLGKLPPDKAKKFASVALLSATRNILSASILNRIFCRWGK